MRENYILKKTISLVIKIARFPKKINAFPQQNQIFSESAKGGLFFLLLLENGGGPRAVPAHRMERADARI